MGCSCVFEKRENFFLFLRKKLLRQIGRHTNAKGHKGRQCKTKEKWGRVHSTRFWMSGKPLGCPGKPFGCRESLLTSEKGVCASIIGSSHSFFPMSFYHRRPFQLLIFIRNHWCTPLKSYGFLRKSSVAFNDQKII